jgi:hypothetical protein
MAMALFPLPGAKTTAELGSSELLPTATATLGGYPAASLGERASGAPVLRFAVDRDCRTVYFGGRRPRSGSRRDTQRQQRCTRAHCDEGFLQRNRPFSRHAEPRRNLVATTVCLLTLVTVVAPNDRSAGLCESSVKRSARDITC